MTNLSILELEKNKKASIWLELDDVVYDAEVITDGDGTREEFIYSLKEFAVMFNNSMIREYCEDREMPESQAIDFCRKHELDSHENLTVTCIQ